MIVVLIILFFSSLYTQIIDHTISKEIFRNDSFEIEVYSDYKKNDMVQFCVYYKTSHSDIYSKINLNEVSENNYSCLIPKSSIDAQYFEYYILLETIDGQFKTIPENSPHEVPISLLVLDESNIFDDFQNSGLDVEANIISPQPEQIVESEDVFIALSYFRVEDLNLEKSQILIDGINMTKRADMRMTNLTLRPTSLSPGEHQIKVVLYNKNGVQYMPIVWNFFITGKEYEYSKKNLSGKVWNDYVSNQVDALGSYSNNTNFNLDYSADWIKIKSRLKKSSLEDNLTQAKDRYTFNIDLNNFNIKYGDIYPNMNQFFITGNRVRGLGFNYKSNFFQIDLISGELSRSIQGDPFNGAVLISDFTTQYDEIDNLDKDYITISRSDYTFKRDVSGLRLGFGNRANFGFNILKAKDDVKSVSKNVDNSIVSLPYEMDVFSLFNSDTFIDLDGNGEYSIYDPIYLDNDTQFQINGDVVTWNYDDSEDVLVHFNPENLPYHLELITIKNSIFVEDCDDLITLYGADDISSCFDETTYDLIQYVWDIKVKSENLTSFLSEQYNIPEDQQIFPENQWDGDKPEDNLVIGTDFSLQSKNKNFKLKTSFAMSLLNENIWNPIKSVNEFDTYSDEYMDCQFGTTYSNPEFLVGEDCTDTYTENGCNYSDYYWHECSAYVYVNGEYDTDLNLWELNNDIEISLNVLEQGLALDAIPDPEDFEDVFHYNFDAIPTIPFYSLVQKAENSESVSFSDILNAPEVAYDIDFSLKVLNNQIKFGIKQVGQSFNTLGNPYLQKDMREKYLSNRIRALENRMFLLLKFSQITNGISDDQTPDISNKYDFNVSYYPGIELPSFTLAFANYSRKSGSRELYDVDINGDELIDENDILDTRVETKTNNFNFSINHSFESKYSQNITLTYFSSSKKDLLYDELSLLSSGEVDTSYVSPRSRNNNLGVSLKTSFNHQWESNFNFSNNYFDYAQKSSYYYEKQRINTIGMSFSYKLNENVKKIGAGVEYINGSGSIKYDQYSIRLYSDILLLRDLDVNIVYNYRIKNIVASPNYNNSLFKINISYRF